MRAAVIGASSESLHGIEVARSLGFDVVALDGDPDAPGLRAADEGYVVDITSPEAAIAALGEAPDVVIPVPIGRYLTTTGVINDHFGIPGVSESSARHCTDKLAFHRTLEQYGLRSTTAVLIPAGQVEHPLPERFPVVVKPRFGSGSRGVSVSFSPTELAATLTSTLPASDDLILEEFAQGVEYGVDAAVVGGDLHIILLREKLNTPLPYRQAVGYYTVPVTHRMYALAAEALGTAVKAIELTTALLHADLIERDGQAFIVEMSARPSGHHLHDLFTPLATGVDPIRQFLTAARDGQGAADFTPTSVDPHLMRFFDFTSGTVVTAPDPHNLPESIDVVRYEEHVLGQEMFPVTNGPDLMKRGFFILRGTDRDDLQRQADAVLGAFTFEGE